MDPRIMSFDSIDDAFAYMEQRTEAANASLRDEQKALTWGSYFVAPSFEGIAIFGYVFTFEEFRERERASYHRDGSPLDEEEEAEFAFASERVKDAHERGYLFGEAFSVVEPRGELGDTHRASAWPITPEQFEAARSVGWDHTQPAVESWLRPLLESIGRG